MKEMLGENNEVGRCGAENSEDALYQGIRGLLDSLIGACPVIKKKASERGKDFNTASTVIAAENLFEELVNEI